MLVLLGISSVIAVIIPNPRRDAREQQERESATASGATGATTAAGSDGATGENGATGATDASEAPAGRGGDSGTESASPAKSPLRANVGPNAAVKTIVARPDSRLILTVESDKPVQVLIPKLGRTAFADRWAPAYLDLILPKEDGSIPVFTTPPGERGETRRAVIRVGEENSSQTPARSDRGGDQTP